MDLKSEADRVPEFDGLRAILAWTVVVAHIIVFSGWFGLVVNGNSLLLDLAACAVDTFILLSGFAITRLRLARREPLPRYFARRACRILPAYWAALIVTALLLPTLEANLRHLPHNASIEPFLLICQLGHSRFWPDLGVHIFLLQGLVPNAWLPAVAFTLLPVAWSLSLEEQFYAVAPWALKWMSASRFIFATILIVSGILTLLSEPIARVFSYGFLPAKIGFFVVGGLTHFAIGRPISLSRVLLWVALPCASLAILLRFGSRFALETWLPATTWFAVAFVAALGQPALLQRILNARPLQLLGRISYSTYLFHTAVIAIVQFVLWKVTPAMTRTNLLIETAVLAVPATFALSYVCWRWIEQPFQRLGRGQPLFAKRPFR